MDRIFRQPSGDRETSPEIHDFARHSDKSSKEAGESQDTNVGEKRPLSASSDKSRLDKKPRPGQEEPGSADFYASQFIPESEGAYSLLEGGHMDKQPGAIEMRPLERYAGRYETEVGLPNSKGYVPVKTKVQGESRISYESMVNLKEGDFHVIEAWRLRTSDIPSMERIMPMIARHIKMGNL